MALLSSQSMKPAIIYIIGRILSGPPNFRDKSLTSWDVSLLLG